MKNPLKIQLLKIGTDEVLLEEEITTEKITKQILNNLVKKIDDNLELTKVISFNDEGYNCIEGVTLIAHNLETEEVIKYILKINYDSLTVQLESFEEDSKFRTYIFSASRTVDDYIKDVVIVSESIDEAYNVAKKSLKDETNIDNVVVNILNG